MFDNACKSLQVQSLSKTTTARVLKTQLEIACKLYNTYTLKRRVHEEQTLDE